MTVASKLKLGEKCRPACVTIAPKGEALQMNPAADGVEGLRQ